MKDACWQANPDFTLIELILNAEPELLLLQDKRGFTALEYARREHWGYWIKYLSYRVKVEIHKHSSK